MNKSVYNSRTYVQISLGLLVLTLLPKLEAQEDFKWEQPHNESIHDTSNTKDRISNEFDEPTAIRLEEGSPSNTDTAWSNHGKTLRRRRRVTKYQICSNDEETERLKWEYELWNPSFQITPKMQRLAKRNGGRLKISFKKVANLPVDRHYVFDDDYSSMNYVDNLNGFASERQMHSRSAAKELDGKRKCKRYIEDKEFQMEFCSNNNNNNDGEKSPVNRLMDHRKMKSRYRSKNDSNNRRFLLGMNTKRKMNINKKKHYSWGQKRSKVYPKLGTQSKFLDELGTMMQPRTMRPVYGRITTKSYKSPLPTTELATTQPETKILQGFEHDCLEKPFANLQNNRSEEFSLEDFPQKSPVRLQGGLGLAQKAVQKGEPLIFFDRAKPRFLSLNEDNLGIDQSYNESASQASVLSPNESKSLETADVVHLLQSALLPQSTKAPAMEEAQSQKMSALDTILDMIIPSRSSTDYEQLNVGESVTKGLRLTDDAGKYEIVSSVTTEQMMESLQNILKRNMDRKIPIVYDIDNAPQLSRQTQIPIKNASEFKPLTESEYHLIQRRGLLSKNVTNVENKVVQKAASTNTTLTTPWIVLATTTNMLYSELLEMEKQKLNNAKKSKSQKNSERKKLNLLFKNKSKWVGRTNQTTLVPSLTTKKERTAEQ